MNLFQIEEEEIIEYYELIFENFFLKQIIENQKKFFKKYIKAKFYQILNYSINCNSFNLTKINIFPEATTPIFIFEKKIYINQTFRLTFKKLNIFLKKKNIYYLYKNLTKIFNNFTLYKVNKIQFLLKINYKTHKEINPIICFLNFNLLNPINKKKKKSVNLFFLNYRIKPIDFGEIILKILTIKCNLKKFKKKKYLNLIKKKNKNQLVNNFYLRIYLNSINFCFFSYFFLIKIINLAVFLFDIQFKIYLKSIEKLLKIGLKFIFNLNTIRFSPFYKLYKKKHLNNYSILKEILNCIIFKIKNNNEQHSIYISPIDKQQFEINSVFVLLKCGHVFIFDYFKSRFNISLSKNEKKKNYNMKCPFCFFISKHFLKFIFLSINF
jgi:hypothetical protein